MKKGLLLVLVVSLAAGGWFGYKSLSSKVLKPSPEAAAELHQMVAAENEKAIVKPEFRERQVEPPNPLKNVYFGDLHVHTSWSFDAYISGNRIDPEQAYRFAKGESHQLNSGERVSLSTPLDFVAITDHAESFGLFEGCDDPAANAEQQEFCVQFKNPTLSLFWKLRNEATKRPPVRPSYCGEEDEFCIRHARSTWLKTQQAADQAYEPGVFTSLYAYEYSPVWPKGGSTHRNVIFRNRSVPVDVVSAYDAATATTLWQKLEAGCTGDCEFLTIPHNLNRYYGKTFSGVDEDGTAYTQDDWIRRRSFEPLVEIYQTKAASECAIGVGTSDEECGFEQFFSVCEDGQSEACAGPNSFARDGLKFGLTLSEDIGFNPLQFGFIGSTDTHNSNPGDTEEWDYRGKSGLKDATAKKRLAKRSFGPAVSLTHSPGGLAAVWARENVREAIFDGLQSKETYATSGTRIRLRVFAGWKYEKSLLNDPELIAKAYDGGVPMGGVLERVQNELNPKFLIWAIKDPIHANLDKIQMVKGWRENGVTKEQVVDVVCSGGRVPDPTTGKCPASDAKVDLKTCQISNTSGEAELKVLWEDQNYQVDVSSFYYVRVLQNPTCRWSTYDAIRLGIEPVPEVQPIIQERAWSSPIWGS